jgi:hypothetical protein
MTTITESSYNEYKIPEIKTDRNVLVNKVTKAFRALREADSDLIRPNFPFSSQPGNLSKPTFIKRLQPVIENADGFYDIDLNSPEN